MRSNQMDWFTEVMVMVIADLGEEWNCLEMKRLSTALILAWGEA